MRLVNRIFLLLVFFIVTSFGVNAAVNPKPFVIPELKEWKGAQRRFRP